MENIRLIASDMDHTLLTEAGQLPPHFGRTLDALEAAGIQFAAASGRPLYTLQDVFGERSDQLALICDNGGVVSYRGTIIHKQLMAAHDYQRIARFVQEHTDGLPLICGIEHAVGARKDQAFDAVYREFYHQLIFVDDLPAWSGEADKVTIYLPHNNAQQVFDEAIAPEFGADFTCAVAGPVWIDITPKHINKAKGMSLVGRKMGISSEQMMAFGDNFNDKEMLAYVAHSYLVANHNPSMAGTAKYQAPSNEEYGVQQVIAKVLATRNH
ncbi:HAD family hydrolase [Lacticaseibacillus mingshuiensis]|uniref:HAD family hydrolase n=1 Tax=Lacticaseibacillus mingshuiensis TaxID=2799574 RepID=UPI0019520A15|nr:HAD family hydrolase [Lacticaseibacillus mingshuiensis]